ncbi:MAG: hypothetical protein A2284_02345 [Deltaproteobacteria bacterium RIFOXYA12_FULL_61_11]|nr:MAG: hypothetical protein A2284_02345 [Deltaproteobacteria bacterium RIFOXYA12_FULL_61_11]
MRIACIAVCDAYLNSVLLETLLERSAIWSEKGVEVRTILISPRRPRRRAVREQHIQICHVPALAHHRWLPESLVVAANAALCSGPLRKMLDQLEPDLVYVRRSRYFPRDGIPFQGYPLVVEAASDTLGLLSVTGQATWTTRGRFLMPNTSIRPAGLICDTRDASERLRSWCANSEVIAAGRQFRGAVPRLAVPKRYGPGILYVASRHDREDDVEDLLGLASRRRDWSMYLAGDLRRYKGKRLPGNVVPYGVVSLEFLRTLYPKCDCALAPLALRRNGLEDAAPLLTREFLAYGLPVIACYRDMDLRGRLFSLSLGTHPRGLRHNIEAIEVFLRRWQEKRVSAVDLEHLDPRPRECKRLAFFRKVLESQL